MRSLFVRIFVSYWIAQALFMLVAIVVIMTMRPQRDTSVWGAIYAKTLTEAVQAYDHGGQPEVGECLVLADDLPGGLHGPGQAPVRPRRLACGERRHCRGQAARPRGQ